MRHCRFGQPQITDNPDNAKTLALSARRLAQVMFIARRELQPDVVYRAAYMEYDVTCPETEGMTANELLDWLFSREVRA